MYKPLLLITVIGVALVLSSSQTHAWLQTYEVQSGMSYGFLYGIWHGVISPFAFVAQWFDHSIVLYSSVNNGWTYNLGYLLGISMVVGGGAKST